MKIFLPLVLFLLSLSLFAQSAPTGPSPQIFCTSNLPTSLYDLEVQGENLVFWDAAVDGTILDNIVVITCGTTYWVSQGSSPSAERLAIEVLCMDDVPAPGGENLQYYCNSEEVTLADLAIFNTSGYTNLYFLSDDNLTMPLTLDHVVQNEETVYVVQSQNTSCVETLTVTVYLLEPIPAPFGYSEQYICANENITLAETYIFNTIGGNEVYWFSALNAIQPLDPTTVIIQDGVTYYAFQGAGSCVEPLPVTFHLLSPIPTPIGNSSITLNQNGNETFLDLPIENTDGFSDIYWYADVNQNVKINPNSIVTDGTYYAFQGIGSCATGLTISVNITMNNEEEQNQFFSIFPNPAHEFISISNIENQPSFSVKVYNLQGQMIWKNETISSDMQINLTDFAKGVYWVEINNTKNSTIEKLIVD